MGNNIVTAAIVRGFRSMILFCVDNATDATDATNEAKVSINCACFRSTVYDDDSSSSSSSRSSSSSSSNSNITPYSTLLYAQKDSKRRRSSI